MPQPFTIPAVLFVVFSLPLLLGIVPRNRFYGVRTPQTLADDALWKAANRWCGGGVLLSGCLYLVVAARWPQTSRDDFGTWLIHLAAFALPLVVALATTGRYLSRR